MIDSPNGSLESSTLRVVAVDTLLIIGGQHETPTIRIERHPAVGVDMLSSSSSSCGLGDIVDIETVVRVDFSTSSENRLKADKNVE